MGERYSIHLAPTGIQSLKAIRDKKLRHEIARAIDGLGVDPERQGKPLVAPFEGLLSMRASRDRYRILYRVDTEEKRVEVFLVAKRKAGRESDVYRLAKKLLKTLLGDPGE
jgi:mRNA-degrading endonuclease RelE of RelBE toxin-antitoxin system